jgi:hypothetical protein
MLACGDAPERFDHLRLLSYDTSAAGDGDLGDYLNDVAVQLYLLQRAAFLGPQYVNLEAANLRPLQHAPPANDNGRRAPAGVEP